MTPGSVGVAVCVGVEGATGVADCAGVSVSAGGSAVDSGNTGSAVGASVGALVGGDGVLVGVTGAGVGVGWMTRVGIAVANAGGGADGTRPKIVIGAKIVVPARTLPSVRQLTRRSSVTEVWDRIAMSLRLSPGLTIYATQLGAWMRWQ